MRMSHSAFPSGGKNQPSGSVLVIPLEGLDRTALPLVGGKAANLGELIHAGFPVPAGFCVTTAAYALVAAHARLDDALLELEAVSLEDSARQIALATAIRTALSETLLPPEVVAAITTAYQALSPEAP